MEKNTVIGVQGGPLHSLINSASRFFTDIPPRVLEVNYWFYHISNLAYTLIALLHASWIWAFSAYGIYPMAQFQGISIVCYIFANVLNRKGYHVPGMILAVTEVIAHQILAASYLGWDCGFQNFLPLMSILPFLKYNRHLAVRLAFGITCLCAYVYMDAYLKHAVPLYALKQRLRSKSLYVGWSGTVPSNKDSILNDHSVATIVERSKLQLSGLISECSVGSLCNREKYYAGEEHNSVPFVANYDALRFLFSFTKPPKTEPISATPEFYSRHYKMVSERMGYTVLPPEELVNGLGYKFLWKKMFDRAQAFFQLNIDNYPDSYNVYDSMSDLYAAKGDKSKAIEYLNKEIKLKDLPYIRQKLSELRAGK